MGKKELTGCPALCCALCCLLILLSGCNTVKGAVGGASEGAKKDWHDAEEADQRLREVLW